MNMDNKVVLITGASRGIGEKTAEKFASKGFNVIINYKQSEVSANALRDRIINDYKVGAISIKADVSNEEEVKAMIDECVKIFGRIDVLVNNAGIVFDRDFEDITINEFEQVLKVNVIGAFIVSREVYKHMPKGSCIVNVSSTNGTKTISPECLDYNISKVGLQSLTRDLAFYFKPNIRVNAIAIGWANTEMNAELPKDYVNEETSKIYLGRFAKPEEIANTIYYLASDEASYINSEILVIDGGM